jgi:hypothetical protein
MFGVITDENHKGIIPRAFECISNCISCDTSKQYLVLASFLEIYNEVIIDLLAENSHQHRELKERPDQGVFVKDLSTCLVENPSKLFEIMERGNSNKHMGETNMN